MTMTNSELKNINKVHADIARDASLKFFNTLSKAKLKKGSLQKLCNEHLKTKIKRLKKAVVFDLDSTLCDCSWRIKYAIDKNWNAFHSGCALDTSITNNILLAKLLQEEGYELLIFTGRTEKYRGDTNQWLSARGIYSDHIAMRSDYNRAQAKDLKLGFLRSFKNLGYDVQMIFDDDKSVRDHLSNHGYLVINSNL